jgi:hypothetical protein
MTSFNRLCFSAILLFALMGADKVAKPVTEEPFKIPPFEDRIFNFTPVARGEVEALVQLDQRECYVNVVITSPSGHAKNSKRVGYTRFRATADISPDDLNRPWTVRIKNFCEMKPVSGVLKLYYPAVAESAVPAPGPASPVPSTKPELPPSPAPTTPATPPGSSVGEVRLDAKNRSSSLAPILKEAALSYDGVTLSSNPADLEHEKQGWVLLGTTEFSGATVTLTFASEGWVAILADFASSSPVEVRLSSTVAPEASSALVLSPPSAKVQGEDTLPTWVKGSPGAIVKITYSCAGIWVRGFRLQKAVPPDSPRL